eukprot:1187023-Prorocentrum_minimum.AAC.2
MPPKLLSARASTPSKPSRSHRLAAHRRRCPLSNLLLPRSASWTSPANRSGRASASASDRKWSVPPRRRRGASAAALTLQIDNKNA